MSANVFKILHFNYMLTGIKTGSVVDIVYVLKSSAIDCFKFMGFEAKYMIK